MSLTIYIGIELQQSVFMVKSKIIIISAFFIVILFFTGRTFVDYQKSESNENNIDESKNNLVIILKKNSTYDNESLISHL